MNKQAAKVIADLQIQAMMFNMVVDWETLTLERKDDYKEPTWLSRWKEKQDGADYDNRLDPEQE